MADRFWVLILFFAAQIAFGQERIESFHPETGEGFTQLLSGGDINYDAPMRASAVQAAPIVTAILTNGPSSNRVTLVFLSEGFTTNEFSKFLQNATNMLNGFTATSPFKEYKAALNAVAIFVPSAESGSDHPNSGVFKNTYFNSSYDSYGVSYSISIPPNDRDRTYENGFGKVDALLESVPEHDISVLIVNDPAYGGSGGYIPISSVATASRDIAIHEVGHRFAGLGDEYTQPYPGYPVYEEPNTTQETRREFIKWNAWIDPLIPIPTPTTYLTNVGLFEGARYFSTGWYRPQRDCKMRTLTAPFCAVCSEALVKNIYSRISPLDSLVPATNIVVTKNGAVNFSVAALPVTNGTFQIQWEVNGIPKGTNSSYVSSGLVGTNIVKVTLEDKTALVRNDPEDLLTASHTWTVHGPAMALPQLGASLSSSNIVLTWSSPASSYVLQAKSSLNASTWQNVSRPAGSTTVTLPLDSQQQYFRLVSTNSL